MRIDTTEMPTVDVESALSGDAKSKGRGAEASSLSILLVDDNDEVRGMLGAMLREAGCAVFEAHGPQHARDLVDARPFDAAVVDLVMPGASGLDVIRELRGLKYGEQLPVVLMSVLPPGGARAEVQDRVRHLTRVQLLHKPITAVALVAAVRRTTPARP